MSDLISQAARLISDKDTIIRNQSTADCESYFDEVDTMLSALNTVKNELDDRADMINRKFKDIKRESRDYRDKMADLKSAKSRVRDHKFNLLREQPSETKRPFVN